MLLRLIVIGMADEELSPAQKLAIGSNFVLNSPPAQVNVVMDGAWPTASCCVHTRSVTFTAAATKPKDEVAL